MERFLVLTKYDDGVESVSLQTPWEIINRVDMSDCSNEEIEVYKIAFGQDPEKLKVLGCWHVADDPLYIAVINNNDQVEFDGYGTDH